MQKYNTILRNNNNENDDDDDGSNNINLYFMYLVGPNWFTSCPTKLMKITLVIFN